MYVRDWSLSLYAGKIPDDYGGNTCKADENAGFSYFLLIFSWAVASEMCMRVIFYLF